MSFDLFPNEVAAQERRATALGVSAPEPGLWTGFSQAPSLIMQGYAKTARAIDLAGAVGPMALDAWNGTGTTEQDAYFKEHDLFLNSAVDHWTPTPGSVGTAAQIVGSLVPMLTTMAINPAIPLLTAGLGTAEDLSKEGGVSAKQAVGAGVIQATGLGLGMYFPAAFGASLAAKIATGAGVNVAQGVATRAGTAAVLSGTEAAKQFNPWDKEGIVIDALMGMGFGALSHLGQPAKDLTPTDKAAILVANQARHLEDTTAPGIPATPVDATIHVEAMKKAIDDVIAGRTAEVGQLVQDMRYLPDEAKVEARKQMADEVGIVARSIVLDEIRNQQSRVEAEVKPGFLRTANDLVALQERAPEFATKYAPELQQAIEIAQKPGFLRTAEEKLILDQFVAGKGGDALLQNLPEPVARAEAPTGVPDVTSPNEAMNVTRLSRPVLTEEHIATWKQRGEAAVDRSFDLGVQRGERTTKQVAALTADEKARVDTESTKAGVASKDVANAVRDIKKNFPVADGWAPLEFAKVDPKESFTQGAEGLKSRIGFKAHPYDFNTPKGMDKAPNPHSDAAKPWVNTMARRMTDEIVGIIHRARNGDKVAAGIIDHMAWYREVARRLRDEFGGFGDMFADLLGATSPNTGVRENFNYSVDLLRRFVRGDFDKNLEAYSKAIDSGVGPTEFRKLHDSDLLRQFNGSQYGMNSVNAAKALVGMWRAVKAGDAPKARNFALNLIGQSDKATIDVWAARFMQRLANYPRIPPRAETGVAGVHLADTDKVGGAFGFGQLVMDKAAAELRAKGIDITAPDLQAVAWFAEKELWTKKNWTSAAGEGGSFEDQLNKTVTDRYQSGATIAQEGKIPTDPEMAKASEMMTGALKGDKSVIAYRALPSVGMYAGGLERSFDHEVVVDRGWKPAKWIADIARIAKAENQWDVMVSRVVRPDESHPNARPGVELYFRSAKEMEAIKPMIDAIVAKGVDGFTLVVDPLYRRGNTGAEAKNFLGLRLQYVPEIAMRWMDHADPEYKALTSGDEAQIQAIMRDKADRIDDAIGELRGRSEVAFVKRYAYDTLVIGKENYDVYTDPGSGRADSAFGGEESGQPIAARLQEAARRLQGEPERQSPADLLQRQATGPDGQVTNRFSRGGTGVGMPRADAEAHIARLSKGSTNLPKTHVLGDIAEAPPSLRDYIVEHGAQHDVEAAFHNGEFYVFHNNVADAGRLEHVLFEHEVTHYGLRGTFGKGVDPVLEGIYNTNPKLAAEADALQSKLGLKSKAEAIEEVLADLKNTELASLKGWNKFVGFVRDWMNAKGMTTLAAKLDSYLSQRVGEQGMADLYVASIVKQARDWAKNGKQDKIYTDQDGLRTYQSKPEPDTTPVPEPKAPEALAPNKTESDFAARVKAKLTGQEAPAGKPKMQVETDPTVLEAQQRIAQYPDMTMEVKAEDGSSRIVNLADELRTVTEDAQRAQIEAPTLFQTAAACFFGAM